MENHTPPPQGTLLIIDDMPALPELGAHTQEDGMVHFWVRDNGPSLSFEAQDQLFTPFTRLHENRGTGHGLGLSTVRQIADKLGGPVGVESAPDQGSLFFVTLPTE